MDGGGRLWTLVESKACRFGLCGRLWTPLDTAWRSTDQKVGGSSPSDVLLKPVRESLSHGWPGSGGFLAFGGGDALAVCGYEGGEVGADHWRVVIE